jgi:predicted GH43/DUF377 family glycosyl hydrolase
MSGFALHRLGMLMEPEPGNPQEVEGVLNPAAVRGPDGKLYLFPRLVAKGNYSRIGIARVNFNEAGDPVGVNRLGIALEPETDYERRSDGTGGCEDPRVTYVEPLRRYMMSYTAFSPQGPRIALAISEDLFHWKRIGSRHTLIGTALICAISMTKMQASFRLPSPIRPGIESWVCSTVRSFPAPVQRKLLATVRPVRWISTGRASGFPIARRHWSDVRPHPMCRFTSHHRLATPVSPWERLKIGAGTPPILTKHGWLIVYHGVCEVVDTSSPGHHLCYSAGVMVLSKEHPRVIRYRSASPVLTPVLPQERDGIVANVVFPTGIDRRDDLGSPDRFDVYYGMADNRIGVARLDLPDSPAGRDRCQLTWRKGVRSWLLRD